MKCAKKGCNTLACTGYNAADASTALQCVALCAAESVQTINQLLTEMDGFEDNTGVIVMAATNRPGALDTALTRPGRFDRVIHLPLPNLQARPGCHTLLRPVYGLALCMELSPWKDCLPQAALASSCSAICNLVQQRGGIGGPDPL